jgi:hypothetical protein
MKRIVTKATYSCESTQENGYLLGIPIPQRSLKKHVYTFDISVPCNDFLGGHERMQDKIALSGNG